MVRHAVGVAINLGFDLGFDSGVGGLKRAQLFSYSPSYARTK